MLTFIVLWAPFCNNYNRLGISGPWGERICAGKPRQGALCWYMEEARGRNRRSAALSAFSCMMAFLLKGSECMIEEKKCGAKIVGGSPGIFMRCDFLGSDTYQQQLCKMDSSVLRSNPGLSGILGKRYWNWNFMAHLHHLLAGKYPRLTSVTIHSHSFLSFAS